MDDAQARLSMAAGGRKAQYDMLSRDMAKNRDDVRKTKEENKSIQQKLRNLKMGQSGTGKDPIEDVLKKTQKNVQRLNQTLNKTKCANKGKQMRVEELQAQINQIELQAPGQADEEAMTKTIRPLENRLEKSMIKYNEAQNIRRTYEQIVKRLKEERTGFDSHLKSLEETMKGKDKDHEDLEILARDAVSSRDASRQELETIRIEYDDFVRWTEDQLNEQRAKVKAREEMEAKMQAREQARFDAEMDAKGELSKTGEDKLKASYVASEMAKGAVRVEGHREDDKVTTYEQAFRKIKEATGVSDVNEIIQKFLTQEDTQNRLNELAKESTVRIEQLTEEKKRVQKKVGDAKMKASSSAGNRRIVDEFEQLLSEAKVKSERVKTKYERLTKVMINVKAGVDHLGEKIHQVLEGEVSPRTTTQTSLIDTLKQCQSRLMHMMACNKDKNDKLGPDQNLLAFFAAPAEGLLELADQNIRIPLQQEEESRASDEDEEGYDDDVLDRRTLKRSSQLLVDKQTRKPRRRKNKSED